MMNKTKHLTIHSILLTGLFFIVCFVLDSCGKKEKETDGLEEAGNRLEQVTDDLSSDDDLFEDDDATDYSDNSESSPSDYSESKNNEEVQADVDYTAAPAKTYRSTGRSYMIVAGNYLVESNADEMVRNLKKKGYSSAEKVVFDLSQYYTVIAARYDDRPTADQTAQRLKREGFDNYVLGSK